MDPLVGTRFHALFHYGQEAVIVFFVLSGFVITYSSSRAGRTITWRTYMGRC
jgi:peptidoglycan/LPS O-acetylase OafA/YrhL